MYKNFLTIILSIIISIILLEFILIFSNVSDAQEFQNVSKDDKISHYRKNKEYSFCWNWRHRNEWIGNDNEGDGL